MLRIRVRVVLRVRVRVTWYFPCSRSLAAQASRASTGWRGTGYARPPG